jgi:alpha-1,2-mannosyltransferase
MVTPLAEHEAVTAVPEAPARRDLPHRLLIPGIAVAAVALGIWIFLIVRHQAALWSMLDLQIYRDGGKAVRTGDHLYTGYYSWVHLPFTYPPFAAWVFAGASYFTFHTLQFVMTAGSMISLVTVCWLAWGKLGYRASAGRVGATLLATAFALWTEPVQQTLTFGQVNLILMLLVMADLCFPERFPGKGVGIGLAAGFKLVPIIFVPYLFLTGRRRAGFVSLGTLAATVAGAYLVMPTESRQYWGGMFINSSRIGGVDYVGDQSLHGWLTRVLHSVSRAQDLYYLVAFAVVVVGLLLAAWQYRRGNELLSIMVTALVGLLASPISWSHHWVWITIALILAVDWAWRKGRLEHWLLPLTLYVLFAAWPQRQNGMLLPSGLIWYVPNNNDLEYKWQGLQVIQGDMYTLIGLLFLVSLAVHWRRSRLDSPLPTSGQEPARD